MGSRHRYIELLSHKYSAVNRFADSVLNFLALSLRSCRAKVSERVGALTLLLLLENTEMKIDLTPLYANTVGFDRFGSLLDAALSADRQSAGYPPYDIELVGENKYANTLAVAGFQDNEIDVQVEKGVLTVRGKKEEAKKDSRYLHRGIATRSFERKFNLADHVEVVNAQLDNGLLKIALLKEIPEAMKPRKIPVGNITQAIDNEVVSES
jgi:molecular chaperone IbpA